MKKTITLLTALLLLSCGSRKTEVSKEQKKVDTEVTAKQTETKTTDQKQTAKVETTKDVTIETKEDNFEIIPIDATKESTATFNGKTYNLKNAKLSNVNKNVLSKDNSKIIENYENELKLSQIREFEHLERISELERSKTKTTERTNTWSLFFLGIAIGVFLCIMLYIGYVKRKENLY